MQYEISGSVLAGQITTSTWAEAAVARATVPPASVGWPVRVVDQGGSAQDHDLGGGAVARGVQLCGGPAQGAPWAKAAVDRAWARRGPGRLSSRRRPGRWLRRGPGRLSSRRSPGRRQRWPGPRYPPRRSTLQWTCPGRALGEGSGRSGLGGGSVEDLGMNASTLERIRFAAANRLCVDVGYEGDVQRVEPYSLRKARGGNVVLYACEAGSSECATYRTGGISEVEVTRQTFVPKYANELLSPGR